MRNYKEFKYRIRNIQFNDVNSSLANHLIDHNIYDISNFK